MIESVMLAVMECFKVREIRIIAKEGYQRFSVEEAVRSMSQDFPASMCKPHVRGFHFKMDQSRNSSTCLLEYHKGVLPRIVLGLLLYADEHIAREWTEKLLEHRDIHAIRTATDFWRFKRFYGSGNDRYVLWKGEQFSSKSEATDDGFQAGLTFRQLCKEVWLKNEEDLSKCLHAWFSSRERFVKAFDEALIAHVGRERLCELLRGMDMTFERWRSE